MQQAVDELNTGIREGTAHVSSTLKEIYFDRAFEIYRSTRSSANVAWEMPLPVAELNPNQFGDASPYLSADGLTIWWQVGASPGGWDIWMATRTDTDPATLWANPQEVTELNISGTLSATPVVSFDELTMWFESNRSGSIEGCDIWVATRASKSDSWSNITNMGSVVNVTVEDTPSWISLDELTLYMFAETPAGDLDLFTTVRKSKSDPWQTPLEIDERNTADDEEKPSLSPNELIMWYGTGPPFQYVLDDIVSTIAVTADCPWDVNLDGVVDPLDAGFVLARFGCTPTNDITVNPNCFRCDQNLDGEVNPLDSGIILAHFGPCPGCE